MSGVDDGSAVGDEGAKDGAGGAVVVAGCENPPRERASAESPMLPKSCVICLGAPDPSIFGRTPTRLVVWDDDPRALAQLRERISMAPGGVSLAMASGSLEDLEIFAQEHLRPDEVYKVCVHPKYGSHEERQARFGPFLERFSKALSQIDVRFATVHHRMRQIATNTIARLLWMERHYPEGFHTVLRGHHPGRGVVILGAGPSLNQRTIAALLEIPPNRRPLFWATNTAARLLPSDFPLDLILTIECADTSVCLAGWTDRPDGPVIANDLMAHDLTWSSSLSSPILPFAQHGGMMDGTLDFLLKDAAMLRVPYGVNGTSALLGLALNLRIPRVVLLGADAAWTGGRVYSEMHPQRRHWYAAPYQTVGDRTLRASITRDASVDEEYARAGMAPLTRDQECISLQTYAGNTTYSGHDLYAPVPWYERLAASYGSQVEYIDASGPDAAAKRHWQPRNLEDIEWPEVQTALPEFGGYSSAKGVERQWRNMVARTRQAQKVLRKVLRNPHTQNRRTWKDWNALEGGVPWLRASGYVQLDMLRREAPYMDPVEYYRKISEAALAETHRWLPGGDYYEAVEGG